MESNFRSYRYGQVLQGIEYNPRLFLYLLIAAITVIFAYQFATQVTTEWVKSAVGFAGLLALTAVLVWPYQAIFAYVILAGCMPHFARGETILGLGGALVYPSDIFLAAFLILEFFRGCMRQTHIYGSTDRWMLVYLLWTVVCVARGMQTYKYSAIGEARDFLHPIAYFVTIHYITHPEQIKSVLKWLGWAAAIIGVAWFFKLASYGFMPRSTGGVELLAASMNAVILGVLLGRDHLTKHRKLAALVIIVVVAFTILSLARGQIGATLVTIPFLLWIGRRYFFHSILLGVIIGVAVAGFIAWLSSQVGSELGSLFIQKWSALIDPAKDPTGNWRLYSYRWELEKIFSNPFWILIGQGFGGYYEWYFSMMDEPIRTGPHNVLIVAWSKMGLLGLILHLAVFGSFYRQAFSFLQRSTDRLQRSVMMILMLCVLQTLVYQMASGLPLYTWIFMGVGTVLPRLWSRQSANALAVSAGLPASRGLAVGAEQNRPAHTGSLRSKRVL